MQSSYAETGQAARILADGGLVVFPTETVYGLGANALDPQAVNRVFVVKGRPQDNPLIVHLADPGQVGRVAAEISPLCQRLLAEFAPGPLTLVLPVRDEIPRSVTAGLDTVAVRIPGHPIAHALLVAVDLPVVAPSANRSGEPSPTTVDMARSSLGDGPDFYLDGGPCEVGLESTVLRVVENEVFILRPGAISESDILSRLPDVTVHAGGAVNGSGGAGHDSRPPSNGATGAVRSPGVRHRHYQPRAKVLLWERTPELARLIPDGERDRERTVVIMPDAASSRPDVHLHVDEVIVRTYTSVEDYARNLYAWFAESDRLGAERILAHFPAAAGIGAAVRDRLSRSSGGAGAGLRDR